MSNFVWACVCVITLFEFGNLSSNLMKLLGVVHLMRVISRKDGMIVLILLVHALLKIPLRISSNISRSRVIKCPSPNLSCSQCLFFIRQSSNPLGGKKWDGERNAQKG